VNSPLAVLAFLLLTPVPSPSPARVRATVERRDIVGTETNLYSREKEELIIRDFFQDKRGGVFLDVGCWHPIKASNTYYLEERLGWSGIAIDALAEMAPRWRRNRPRSVFLNYVVTDTAGTMQKFYRVELTDISAVQKPKHGPGGLPVASTEVLVPTITLTKALDDQKVARIDFMSIDIEGAEIPALRGFDIRRFRPALVCIEAKPRNREAILAYFRENGYRRIDRYLEYDTANWYFTPIDTAR
jgi:FkbM family methyltransferase